MRDGARGIRWTALAALPALALAGLAPRAAAAQDVGESIRSLGEANAERYLHPVVSGLGAALNTGFFHTAAVHRPLGFDVGVQVMGAFAPAEAEAFVPALPASITFDDRTFTDPYGPAGELTRSPTAMGAGPGLLIVPQGEFRDALLAAGEDPADWAIRFPSGADLPAVPLSLLQATVGVPAGTAVTVRFTPTVEIHQEIGSLSVVGGAVRHSLDRWLPPGVPLRVTAAVGIQRLTLGEYLSLTARQAALVAGPELGPLSLYGVAGIEGSSAEVRYTVDHESVNPALPAGGTELVYRDGGDNWGRLAAGLTVHLSAVMLNAEYSVARYPVAGVKLILGTR